MRTCAYTSATPGITAELAVATEASFIDVEVDQKNDFLIDWTIDAVRGVSVDLETFSNGETIASGVRFGVGRMIF